MTRLEWYNYLSLLVYKRSWKIKLNHEDCINSQIYLLFKYSLPSKSHEWNLFQQLSYSTIIYKKDDITEHTKHHDYNKDS